jgi:hypothetical protein
LPDVFVLIARSGDGGCRAQGVPFVLAGSLLGCRQRRAVLHSDGRRRAESESREIPLLDRRRSITHARVERAGRKWAKSGRASSAAAAF